MMNKRCLQFSIFCYFGSIMIMRTCEIYFNKSS